MKPKTLLRAIRKRFERGEDAAGLLIELRTCEKIQKCHCEEQSDEAISNEQRLLRFARNDIYRKEPIVSHVLSHCEPRRGEAISPEFLILRAAMLIAAGRPTEALKELAVVRPVRSLSPPLQGEFHLRHGQALAGLGRLREAARSLGSAERLFRKSKRTRDADKALVERAVVLRKAGDAEGARRLLEEVLSRFPNRPGANAAGVRVNLANALIDLGRYSEGLRELTYARRLFERVQAWQGAAHCANSSAAVRISLGLFRDAAEGFREAEALFRRAGDALSEQRSRANLGLCLAHLGKPEGAKLLKRAAKEFGRAGFVLDEVAAWTNLLFTAPSEVSENEAERTWRLAEKTGSDREKAALSSAAGFAFRGRKWTKRAYQSARRVDLPGRTAEGQLLAVRAGGAKRRLFLERAISELERAVSDSSWRGLPWTGGLNRLFWSRLFEEIHRSGSTRLAARAMNLARFSIRRGGEGLVAPRPAEEGRIVEVFLGHGAEVFLLLRERAGRERMHFRAKTRILQLLQAFDEEIALAEAESYSVRNTKAAKRIERILSDLRREVFGGLEQDFRKCERLEILPAGLAYRIPFQALGLQGVGGRNIEIVHRLGSLRGPEGRSNPAPLSLRAPKGRSNLAIVIIGNTEGIPEARREAREVAEFLNGRLIDAAKVSKAEILRAYRSAGSFHFFGHCVGRPDNPGLSFLDMGRGEALFADEIAKTRTRHSPFVLLAACSAADAGGGPGLVSAFLRSGAREVHAARWRVADGRTQDDDHPWFKAAWEKWIP